jgi:hypothetical protein
MKLLIKFPTRARHDKFFEVLDMYYEKLSGDVEYEFLITCDEDDVQMNNPDTIKKLESYENLSFYFGARDGKIGACNRDIERVEDYDIVMQTADDMIPVVNGFDKIIVDEMEDCFPDLDGVLWFFDGYNMNTDTLCIMGRKYYERFGYVYYPEYITWFADTEFTEVADRLDKLAFIRDTIIEHQHPDWTHAHGHNGQQSGYDELYVENDRNEDREYDEELFNRRKMDNFGLEL